MRVTGQAQRLAWQERRLPPVEQVRPGLWSVPVPIPDNPLRYTLTYVLEARGGLLVVDPGWNVDAAWTALTDGIAVLGGSVSDVVGVVVTHVHADHHGLSGRLRERSGAWIAMHPREVASLPSRTWPRAGGGTRGADARADPVAEDRRWLRRCGLPEQAADDLVLRPETMEPFWSMADPDRLLEDGDLVPDLDRPLRAVWTPGHTPGHLCLHEETEDVLLTGDHVLPRISPNIGLQPHTAEPPLAAYLASLRTVAGRFAGAEVLPAHEYRFAGLAGRVAVLLEHHEHRCAEIVAILRRRGTATAWQVAVDLTWSRTWERVTGFMRRAAVAETDAHLQYLRERGRVRSVADPAAGDGTAREYVVVDP